MSICSNRLLDIYRKELLRFSSCQKSKSNDRNDYRRENGLQNGIMPLCKLIVHFWFCYSVRFWSFHLKGAEEQTSIICKQTSDCKPADWVGMEKLRRGKGMTDSNKYRDGTDQVETECKN